MRHGILASSGSEDGECTNEVVIDGWRRGSEVMRHRKLR